MTLYVNTFGNFDIIANEKSMLKGTSRQYRLFRLFQYFITYRNKKLLPETIIDNLLQDTESDDPKNVLRTQIYRLRQILRSFIPKDADEADYMEICFINGYYSMEIGDKVILDTDMFEKLISDADDMYDVDINQASEMYKIALDMYKGFFFSENAYEVWLVPTRNYYNRLYLKVLFKYIDILNGQEKYEKIMEICENSLTTQPYEESVHATLMDAMISLGQINNAISHYDYTTTVLEREVGIKSSPALNNIYRKIQNHFAEKVDLNIHNLNNKLDGDEERGALQCEFDYFKFLYNVQKRRLDRSNEFDYVCVITFKNQNRLPGKETNNWKKLVGQVIGNSLRNGDIFAFWNDIQLLLMTHDVRDNGNAIIENRIRKNLYNINMKDLDFIFQPLASTKSIF